MVRHHEAADAVLRAGRADDHAVVGADRGARLRVAVVGRRARDGPGDRHPPLQLAGRRVERGDGHVERQHEDVAVAEGDAAVGDDAEVPEDGDVVRRPAPLDLAGRRVERPDVVVVRRHVQRPVRLDRIRLLAAADARVDLAEVDGEEPAELRDVPRSDLRQRRVPVLVRRVAEAAPADVGRGASGCGPAENHARRERRDEQRTSPPQAAASHCRDNLTDWKPPCLGDGTTDEQEEQERGRGEERRQREAAPALSPSDRRRAAGPRGSRGRSRRRRCGSPGRRDRRRPRRPRRGRRDRTGPAGSRPPACRRSRRPPRGCSRTGSRRSGSPSPPEARGRSGRHRPACSRRRSGARRSGATRRDRSSCRMRCRRARSTSSRARSSRAAAGSRSRPRGGRRRRSCPISATGSRSGSTRSVMVAMPDGTSGIAARSRTAAATARSSRVGDVAVTDAAIERDVSSTNSACTSFRTRSLDRRSTTGCAAATPSRTIAAAASVGRTSPERVAGGCRPSARRTAPARLRPSSAAPSGSSAASATRAASGVRNVISSRSPARRRRRRGARSGPARCSAPARCGSRAPRSGAAAARGRTWRSRPPDRPGSRR